MLLCNRYQYDPKSDLIGKGGFSRVYRATDMRLNRKVALKIYRKNDMAEKYGAGAEIQRAIEIDHPNICRYIDIEEVERENAFGETDMIQVCIMELLDGGNLAQYYKANPDLTVFRKLTQDVLAGLSVLHRVGIIHRDIKPGNILVKNTIDGPIAKITDFGISKKSGSSDNSTSSALVVSIPYMAPEQLNVQKYGIDGRVSFNIDLWTLGVTLYEILSGDVLFKNDPEESSEQIMANIMSSEIPAKINKLPPPFSELVARCVIKNAADRVNKPEELMAILNKQGVEWLLTNSKAPAAIDLTVAGEILPASEPPAADYAPVPADSSADAANLTVAPIPSVPVEEQSNGDDTIALTTEHVHKIIADAHPHAAKSTETPLESALPAALADEGDVTVAIKHISPTLPDADHHEPIAPGPTPIVDNTNDTVGLRLPDMPLDADDTAIIPKHAIPVQETANEDGDPNDTRPLKLDQFNSLFPAPSDKTVSDDDTMALQQPTRKDNTNSDAPTMILEGLPGNSPQDEDETVMLTAGKKPVQEKEPLPSISEKPAPKGKMMTLFGRYEYYPESDFIGKGGFSRVYRAHDKKLDRWVALKVYKTGEFSEKYSPIAEIQRVVNLDHPNICRYLDIEEIEKQNPFGESEIIQVCVMELLDAGNLMEFYRKNNDLNLLLKLLKDILRGLSYLHKKGIIHRDIKPANILIRSGKEDAIAKITDFGISKATENINNQTSSALVVSIPYMAPEQLNIRKYGIDEKISYNLDLWSLGVTIYEVITGKVLFKNSEQESSEQIMTNIMADQIPPAVSTLPEPFRTVVERCLIKDARRRVQRADDLLDLLNAVPPVVKPAENVPAPVVPAKSRFLQIDEDVEKKVTDSEQTKKIKKPVRISVLWIIPAIIAAGAIMFIFFKLNKPAPSIEINPAAAKSDSLQNSREVPAKPADSSINVKKTEPPPAPVPVKPPENTTDKTAKKQAEKKRETEKPEPRNAGPDIITSRQNSGDNKYSLSITTDASCSMSIEQVPSGASRSYGDFEANGGLNIRLFPGEYVLKATRSDGSGKFKAYNISVGNDKIGKRGSLRVRF